MKKSLFIPALLISVMVAAQKEVPQEVMQQVYEEIKTPHKYGLVMVPEND